MKTYRTIILACCLVISAVIAYGTVGKMVNINSSGSDTAKLQTRLQNLGYYIPRVDGIYGIVTQNAVTAFQARNGLLPDGSASPQTLAKLGLNAAATPNPADLRYSNDLTLLARVISAEAKDQPYNGQVAVGAVVMNRTFSPSFPNSISSVVYQPGGFPTFAAGLFDAAVPQSAYSAARDALNGIDPTGGALYFYDPDRNGDKWLRSRPVVRTIGNYAFCK